LHAEAAMIIVTMQESAEIVNRHPALSVRFVAAFLAVSVWVDAVGSHACDCERQRETTEQHACCPAPAGETIGSSSSCCPPLLVDASMTPSQKAPAPGITESPTLRSAFDPIALAERRLAPRKAPPPTRIIVLRI
jgi:hypothetical protein